MKAAPCSRLAGTLLCRPLHRPRRSGPSTGRHTTRPRVLWRHCGHTTKPFLPQPAGHLCLDQPPTNTSVLGVHCVLRMLTCETTSDREPGGGECRPCLCGCNQPESGADLLFRNCLKEHDPRKRSESLAPPAVRYARTSANQILHRPDIQLFLDVVDGVLNGHRPDCSLLLHPDVEHAPCEGDEYLSLPRSQLGLEARYPKPRWAVGCVAEKRSHSFQKGI